MKKPQFLLLSALISIWLAFPSFAAPDTKSTVNRSARALDSNLADMPTHRHGAYNFAFDKVQPLTQALNKVHEKTAKLQSNASNDIDLRGYVTNSASWGFEKPIMYGFYSIPQTSPGELGLLAAAEYIVHSGYDDGEGTFYSTYFMEQWYDKVYYMVTFDTETWKATGAKMMGDYSLMATDVALDPVTGDVYGCYYSPDGSSFLWGKGDYTALTTTPIKALDQYFWAVGCDKNGQYYAVSKDFNLYKVAKTTGELELVAPITGGFTTQYLVSGCINDKNNTFLVTSSTDNGGGLYQIDLATGVSTLLTNFSDSEEVVALHIAKTTDPKAPAAPTLEVTCEKGSMEAKVRLTMPSTLFDGTTATGQSFAYSVMNNGSEVMSGNAAAGEVVEKTVAMQTSGNTEFVANVTNAAGKSPKAKAACFIGKGSPKAPANVVLAIAADGQVSLTWDAVTTSADEGYFDPEAVTYTVTDSKGTVVASEIKGTSHKLSIEVPQTYTQYFFYLTAVYDGKSSTATKSNTVALGSYGVPLNMDLSKSDNFAAHTLLDANKDGKTWRYNDFYEYVYYNASSYNNADDWLFSPAIKLDGGQAYKFTATVSCSGADYPERLEVLVGATATPEAMTAQVIAPTIITSKTDIKLTGYITVAQSDAWHIGFHAISDAMQYNLNLKSYEISAPLEATLPGAVSDIAVTPATNGDLSATISFKAPEKTVTGNALTGEVKVKVLRGKEEIKTISTTAGTETSFDDAVSKVGEYTYTFISYSAGDQEGMSATATAYIGPKAPRDINEESVTLVETTPGTFNLVWSAISTDIDGNAIPAANISYKIYTVVKNGSMLSIGEEVGTTTECKFTYKTEPITRQQLFYLAVQPFNRQVGSARSTMGRVLVGTPYELPVIYTGNSSTDQYLSFAGQGTPEIGNYFNFEVKAQDGDDSFYAIMNSKVGFKTYLQTGMINLTGKSPAVSLYVYSLTNSDGTSTPDGNMTTMSVICDGNETVLDSFTNEDLEGNMWHKKKFSLEAFAGKTVMIRITATSNVFVYTMYDNIRVFNDLSHDLAASINANTKVNTGEMFDIDVKVANRGSIDAANYTVTLYRDGIVADQKTIDTPLASDSETTVTFTQTLGITDPASVEYHAVVTLDGDENTANDKTETVVVTRTPSSLFSVTGLQGEKTQSGNELTWTPISTDEKRPEEITEDFESAMPFAQEYADWTFVDLDNSPVGGLRGVDMPGITPTVSTLAFFVFDNTGCNSTLNTKSGSKFLAALCRSDGGKTDDWAISPLLTGEAQTISFYARSYNPFYAEYIEVWYTTDESTDPADYIKIEQFGTQEVPSPAQNGFTQYTVDLPDGAKHFAIRSCASDSYMLMIEDVTFTKLNGFDGELLGYNVYRNGVKINQSPIVDAKYTDTTADNTDHTYQVSAVYDKGESELSEPVSIAKSGLGLVSTDAKITVADKAIIVSNVSDRKVTVCTTDGRNIYTGCGDARISVSTGIYIVTIDTLATKVIVR